MEVDLSIIWGLAESIIGACTCSCNTCSLNTTIFMHCKKLGGGARKWARDLEGSAWGQRLVLLALLLGSPPTRRKRFRTLEGSLGTRLSVAVQYM